MLQALLAGVASIKAQQTRMNVIGASLANVNTTAYKSSRVTFQDMISQTVRSGTTPTSGVGGQNPVQLGLGVLLAGTDVNSSQGSLNATNRPTDLAIQGAGFFMVGNGARIAYTRDGAFELDANGDLVHRATGERVLGWSADSTGAIDTSQAVSASSGLKIPLGQLNAVQVTTKVQYAGNLNAAAAPTDEWNTTVRVYDSLGGPHDIKLRLFNRIANPPPPAPPGSVSSWSWQATEPPSNTILGGSEGGSPTGQRLYFDADGKLINTSAVNTVNVPAGNSPAFSFTLDFSKITQLATETQVHAASQDGFSPGSLSAFSVGGDGTITGVFTNGLTRSLGRIALTLFPNPNGLERMGNNLWAETVNSGIGVVGGAQSGGRGTLNVGFLEQSNVDIGNEFTDLIVTQRGFQANTRVVTTVDEMLQDLLNMKR